MKFERLGNITAITSGGTPLTSKREYYDNGTIPWVKTGDLKVKDLSEIPDSITELGLENSSAKIFPVNTVLVAMYGATIGACSILKKQAATNQACAAILPNENLTPDYLFFYLSSIKKELIRKGIGGGQPNISGGILKDTKIYLPSLSQQIHIANILTKAETLIQQRKQSIALLDEFLKSTFLEMFGDPLVENKKWEKEPCGNLFDMKLGKMLSAKNYTGTNLKKYLRNVNVKWGDIDLSDVKEMDFSEKEIENYNLLKGDILVCEGGDVGRTAVLKNDLKGYCYQNALHRLRIKNLEIIDANYFSWYMYVGVTKGLIKKETTSVTIQHFTQDKFKKLKIPIPPIELQNQFAHIVAKTETLKQQCQQSLQQLQQLFGSLSQQAFKGELKTP